MFWHNETLLLTGISEHNIKEKSTKTIQTKDRTADLGKTHTLRVTLKQLFANGLEINTCLKYIDNNNNNKTSSLVSFEPLPFFCL